ncbi:Protein kinase domain, partial [Dillenia turbinata]
SPSEELKKHFSETDPLALILVGILGAAAAVVVIGIFILWKRRVQKQETIQANQALRLYDSEKCVKEFIESGQFKEGDKKDIDVPFFHLVTILAATDDFSDGNKLGQGGFGPVYKGKFPEGLEIAVKRLSSGSGQGLGEFKNEVVLIAKLQHRNLVRLLGYCIEGDEKILLYEYMPNKSLDSFLFDRTQCVLLDWQKRFDIILGVARGLLYLHQDSRLRIIHRDLKTSNILLDEEMNPKISDFGLARIVGGKQIEGSTESFRNLVSVKCYDFHDSSTLAISIVLIHCCSWFKCSGYMSPEYALGGIFSVKSDVFSFGVVLLEIISGKRNSGFYQSSQTMSLLGYAWSLWVEQKALDLMDQILFESCDSAEVMRCINVGLLCVQDDPSDRPLMSNVVFMLSNEFVSLPEPKQPAFLLRRTPSSTASSSTKPDTINQCSISEEDGR